MISKRLRVLSVVIAVFAVASVLFARSEFQKRDAIEAHEEWKKTRIEEMRGEESSWLNLAGLFWLEEGISTFGSGGSNDFVLTEGDAPAQVGRFIREADIIYFEPADGAGVSSENGLATSRITMKDDMGSESTDATVLSLGSLKWWIISRDGMLGVRVRNMESPAWKAFEDIERYDFDRDWKIAAQFLPFEEPRPMEYPTVLGTMRTEEAPGVLVFNLHGQQFEMVPFERSEGTRLFLVFGDETNGASTYSGGRFLYVDWPSESGRATIDFNRAYNPPCAFSDYSTCPQPLPQNRLPVEILAGERVYSKSLES